MIVSRALLLAIIFSAAAIGETDYTTTDSIDRSSNAIAKHTQMDTIREQAQALNEGQNKITKIVNACQTAVTDTNSALEGDMKTHTWQNAEAVSAARRAAEAQLNTINQQQTKRLNAIIAHVNGLNRTLSMALPRITQKLKRETFEGGHLRGANLRGASVSHLLQARLRREDRSISGQVRVLNASHEEIMQVMSDYRHSTREANTQLNDFLAATVAKGMAKISTVETAAKEAMDLINSNQLQTLESILNNVNEVKIQSQNVKLAGATFEGRVVTKSGNGKARPHKSKSNDNGRSKGKKTKQRAQQISQRKLADKLADGHRAYIYAQWWTSGRGKNVANGNKSMTESMSRSKEKVYNRALAKEGLAVGAKKTTQRDQQEQSKWTRRIQERAREYRQPLEHKSVQHNKQRNVAKVKFLSSAQEREFRQLEHKR